MHGRGGDERREEEREAPTYYLACVFVPANVLFVVRSSIVLGQVLPLMASVYQKECLSNCEPHHDMQSLVLVVHFNISGCQMNSEHIDFSNSAVTSRVSREV